MSNIAGTHTTRFDPHAISFTRSLSRAASASPAVIYTRQPSFPYEMRAISENLTAQFGYRPAEFLKDPSFWASRIHPLDAPRVFQELSQMIEAGGGSHSYRFLDKTDCYHWVQDEFLLVRDEQGKPAEIIGYWSDINESRNVEEALRQREEKCHSLPETTPDAIVVIDRAGNIVFVNPEAERLFGYQHDELLEQPVELLLPECLQQKHSDHRNRSFGKPRNYPPASRLELYGVRKNGAEFPVEVALSPIATKEGPLVIGTVRDVTERRKTEEALRASEERYRVVAETASDAILTIDEDNRILFANGAAARMFGHSVGDLHAMRLTDLMPDPWGTRQEKAVQLLLQTGALPVDWRMLEAFGVRKGGGEFPLEVSFGEWKQGDRRYFTGILRDITERKRAEEQLREKEESFRYLFQNNPIPMWVYDLETLQFLEVNGAATDYYGYSRDEFLSMRLPDIQPLDDVPLSFQEIEERWKIPCPEKVPSLGLHRLKNGRLIYANVMAHKITFGERDAIIAAIDDITERKTGEAALRESEARLKEAQRIAQISYWTWNPVTGEFSWGDDVCPFCYRDAGFAPEGCHGCSPSSTDKPCPRIGIPCPMHKLLYPFVTAQNDMAMQEDAVEQSLAVGKTFELETEFVHRDGKRQWVFVRGRQDPGGKDQQPTLHGTVQDITERKAMEAQLRFAQRMEAVGRLAGGVAHDFNNMLNIIQGFSQLIAERLGPKNPILRMVDQIQKASNRAADLTRQLLAFSRQQLLQPTVININSVVSETEKMIRRVIGENIEMVVNLDPEAGFVKADQTQLAQVIVNLAVNARDAMPNGGELFIATANAIIDESHQYQGVTMVPGRYVLLKVRDTGHGMDAETQARIFEPFFTTKGPGKGTGLGLASVYGTIKQSGGYIWVYSEVGKGTCFKIYLPQELKSCAADRPSNDAPIPTHSGGETVLIVEDEEDLRAVTQEFLSEDGYTVLEAANGSEALGIAEKHAGPIHLVVTDVVMPGMSGRETAEQLTLLNPHIKVLYVSGYMDNEIHHRGVLEPDIAFLEKPFTKNALLCKVRELLDFSGSRRN